MFHSGVVIWIKIIDGSRLHNRLTKAFPLVRSGIDTNFVLSGFGSNHNCDNTGAIPRNFAHPIGIVHGRYPHRPYYSNADFKFLLKAVKSNGFLFNSFISFDYRYTKNIQNKFYMFELKHITRALFTSVLLYSFYYTK